MGIRQLEEFLGQADQKGFWIFTYANLGGAFLGAFVGNSLLEQFAPSLKLLGIIVGVILGAMSTWKVKGHPIYRWVLSHAAFVLRRYLKIGFGDSSIDSALYYRGRAVRQEPFMVVATRDGRPVPVLVHRGSGPGAAADLFDGLVAPIAPVVSPVPISSQGERAWNGNRNKISAEHTGATFPSSATTRGNGHLADPSGSLVMNPPDENYDDWDL